MESKALLRKRFREVRKSLLPRDHARLSEEACRRVAESPLWQQAKTVLLYAPLGAELDVSFLVEEGWRCGKWVIFPKCRENPRSLDFFEAKSWEDLNTGAWGIREPDEERCRAVKPEDIDLALIPVVAMDETGVRLGNGGGYYDRVMEKFTCPVLIGFDQQLAPSLPRENHDRTASWLATPTRMIQVRDI